MYMTILLLFFVLIWVSSNKFVVPELHLKLILFNIGFTLEPSNEAYQIEWNYTNTIIHYNYYIIV